MRSVALVTAIGCQLASARFDSEREMMKDSAAAIEKALHNPLADVIENMIEAQYPHVTEAVEDAKNLFADASNLLPSGNSTESMRNLTGTLEVLNDILEGASKLIADIPDALAEIGVLKDDTAPRRSLMVSAEEAGPCT